MSSVDMAGLEVADGSHGIARGSIASAILIGTSALMVLGMQPIILGGLAKAGRLSHAQLGQVAMIEVLALAVGAIVGPRILNRGAMRALTALLCLLLGGANLAMLIAATPAEIFLARGVAGLLEGLTLGSALVVLTHAPQADRVNGTFLAVQTIPQMIAVYTFPTFVLSHFGIDAAFVLLTMLAFIAAAVTYWLPDIIRVSSKKTVVKFEWSLAAIVALAALTLQSAGIAGAWAYVEVLATQRQLSAGAVGYALAGLLATQVIGGFFVAWIGWKASANWALLIGTISQTAIIFWLSRITDGNNFVLACMAFGIFWLALQPFQLRQLILIEQTRRVAMLLVPTVLLGMSLGPLIMSFFLSPTDIEPAFWAGGALIGASVILYAVLALIAPSDAHLDKAAFATH